MSLLALPRWAPCPRCADVPSDTCPVCDGAGQVLPMVARFYHQCHAIIARLRQSGAYDDPACADTLGLTAPEWQALHDGALCGERVRAVRRLLGWEE